MLTYEYKLDGTPAQYAAIEEGIRVGQFLRNKCVRAWMDRTEEGKHFAAMSAYTAVLAQQFAFAAKLGSQARQAAAERAWKAVQRFYDNCKQQKPGKKGYPRFKHDCRSIEYKVAGWKLEPDGKHITFTDGLGIGRLRLIGTRSIETFPDQQIKRVRLIRRADGYYCQFCVAATRQVEHGPTGKQTGIDVGLNAFSTDSDGNTVANPRYYRKSEGKLKRLQREVSRKSNRHKDTKKVTPSQRGNKYPRQTPVPQTQPQATKRPQSHNYQKARKALSKQHLHVQRQREDYARKVAYALVMSSDLIAFEDLHVRNMVKNHHLAKSISDAGWSLFLGWVQYYADLAGIECIAVPPAYTSQNCSGCGQMVQKSLSVRTHGCPHCGLILDRDQNAALNILQEALRILGHRKTAPARPEATLGDRGAATAGA
jgi:putative transposase